MAPHPAGSHPRFDRDELAIFEASPELHAEITAKLRAGQTEESLDPLFTRASALPRSVQKTVAAARFARQRLTSHLDSDSKVRLDDLEHQVLALKTGPSVLKSVLYRLARTNQIDSLLHSTWFDDLFERVETRRLTDHESATTT